MHSPQIILIVLFTIHVTLNLVGILIETIKSNTSQERKSLNIFSIFKACIFMTVVHWGGFFHQ